jgi:anti-sigma B factor antagonist
VLEEYEIAAPPESGHSLAKAILASRSQLSVEKNPGHCTGEELIPLLDDENKRVDKQEIDIVTARDSALARIYGRIDIDSSPALRDRLLALFQSPHTKVVTIDLSAVTRIDSSGVATLIEALRIARRRDTEVNLQGLEGRLLQLFQSTGILSLFNGSTEKNSQSGSKAV